MTVTRQNDVARFITTQWTDVLAARGQTAEARQSLRQLCEHYYAPVFAFINIYTGYDQNARDWTHEFFAKLMEGHSLKNVSSARGRFRSYLLGAVKHFLSDERTKASSQKRGGRVHHLNLESINERTTNLASELPSDACFDRQWAIALLQQGLKQLEFEVTGIEEAVSDSIGKGDFKARLFAFLRPCLIGTLVEQSQADIAAQLGVSAEVVKVNLHRWRKRFREIVKAQVAATVDSPAEIEEELRYLVIALTQ